MPTYDFTCKAHGDFEHFSTISKRHEAKCPQCSGKVERIYKANSVIGDDIPGGMVVDHVLTNPDGSPMRVYSKSELFRKMKEKGYENYVQAEHTGKYEGERKTVKWF